MNSSAQMKFLQHVLLVDDRALPFQTDQPAEEFEAPSGSEITDLREDEPALHLESSAALAAPHDVDVRGIANTLADSGIACSVLAPGNTDDPDRQRVLQLARISDLVLLDWAYVRATSDGVEVSDASGLVGEIVAADAAAGGRLRLLVIYTRDHNIDQIRSKLVAALTSHHDVVEQPTPTTIRAPNVRVTIVGKPGNASPDVATKDGSELAEWIQLHFAETYSGLLPGLALEGVAAVRHHAYRLLYRFPAKLDPAFLSHAAMAGIDDSAALVRALLADEMASALAASAEVEAVLHDRRETRIEELLDHPHKLHWIKKHGKDSSGSVPRENAARLLRGEGDIPTNTHTVTSLGCGSGAHDDGDWEASGDAARVADYGFAGLTLFRRTALEDGPELPNVRLELGVIVEDASSPDSFFLCVQPLCDSVRLSGRVSFPFLPATLDSVDLVVPTSSGWRPLSVECKLSALIQFSFEAPTPNSPIMSVWDDETKRHFVDEAGGPLLYVGTLRPEQAARQAERLGASASRIGLDESEWIRKAREH